VGRADPDPSSEGGAGERGSGGGAAALNFPIARSPPRDATSLIPAEARAESRLPRKTSAGRRSRIVAAKGRRGEGGSRK